MKKFLQAMAKHRLNGFEFLSKKFSKLSQDKLRGIFNGPQIREVLMTQRLKKTLNTLELRAWHAFKWIWSIFLKNFKSPSYQKGVAKRWGVACL